jgi:hypothetical protein
MRCIVFLFLLSTLSLSAQEISPKVYFIYNASGTLAGELNYLYGKYFLDEHCELCDITHSTVSAKPEWKTWISALKCENYVLHTNEANEMKVDYSAFELPVVLVDRGNGMEELVTKKEMADSGKGVEAFGVLFYRKLDEFGLSCP